MHTYIHTYLHTYIHTHTHIIYVYISYLHLFSTSLCGVLTSGALLPSPPPPPCSFLPPPPAPVPHLLLIITHHLLLILITTRSSSLMTHHSSSTTHQSPLAHSLSLTHTYIQHPPEDSKHPLQSALLDAARASGRPSTLPQCGLPSSLATSSSSTRSLCSRIRTRIGNASQALGGLLLVRIQRGAVSEQDPSSWPGLCCGLDSPLACWRSSTSGHHADGR